MKSMKKINKYYIFYWYKDLLAIRIKRLNYLSMCHGFQIIYFNIQQLSIVLMIALLEHFNLDVNVKVSFRSNDSKLGMLF